MESDRSSEAPSGGETVSSSGLNNYDVGIFYHETISQKVVDAEKKLLENGITACLSQQDAPASRSKLANLYSIAKRTKLRVFVVTDKFVNEDFAYHLRLLENADVSTKENTLLLMRKSQLRHIPDHLKDFTCRYFQSRIDSGEIASFIEQFLGNTSEYKDKQQIEDVINEVDAASIDVDEPPNEEIKNLEEDIKTYESKFKKFEQSFGKVSKKRCYILVASPIPERSQLICPVISIPWTRIFDFDPKSRVNGLLCWVEEKLKKTHYTISDQIDSIEYPADDIINWVFINGYTDNADTLQMNNRTIPEPELYQHGEILVDYCVGQKVPVIVVMWYPRYSNIDKNLDTFLSSIRHHFMGRLQSFNCIVCIGDMPNKRSTLYATLDRLDLLDSLIVVPLEILCAWFQRLSTDSPPTMVVTKTLPKYPDQGEQLVTVEIREDDLIWIRTQFYILVTYQLDNTKKERKIPRTIVEKISAFLRGGEIDWSVIDCGWYDVKRDLLDEAKQYITEKHINTGKPGLITIFHSPGGGGTTFARRLVFELRQLVPCGELMSDHIVSKKLEDILISIRNMTRLPTVLLLDGRSMSDVKKILSIRRKLRLIVIHVRRCYTEWVRSPSGEGKFFLNARVSENEADAFGKIYTDEAPEKQCNLNSLCTEVKSGETHYVFEYGLTAFQAEFQGVRRYVHGYLQMNRESKPLNWHKVLVFLSMANYYGHRGLPSKLFDKILGKADNETVELDDLPHAARQFITEHDQTWKITHYVVGKLILEQVFVKRQTTEYDISENSLTKEACKELCYWSLMFIDTVKAHVRNSAGKLASHIYEILTAIFIRRNYGDPGENELDYRPKKAHYSKLLEETSSKSDQREILKRLVESFPRDAEYRAHLGRFHSKQGEFDQAEICFNQATEIRRNEVRIRDACNSTTKTIRENTKGDIVLERIYNMAGFACMSHIRSEIGVRLGQIKNTTLLGKKIPTLIRSCLNKANRAIKNFEDGRLWYQKGSNHSFANLGELKVRLQLSELAKQVSEGNFETLLMKASPYKELGEFVLSSFHECDMLLAHCISDRSRNLDVPEEEINFCFNHFNYFYSNAKEALEKWAGYDTSIRSMKCHLSILKKKLKQTRKWFKLGEDVKTVDEIKSLVSLCERICDAVFKEESSNVRISSYMMEWLGAIRHRYMENRHTQLSVLSRVEKWKERKETGSLANFYYYVLKTTLSLCSVSRETADVHSRESRKMKDYLEQNDNTPTHLLDISEWLSCGDDLMDFNRLIPSAEMGEWKGKFWTDPAKIARLEVCTGTISFCRPYDGRIIIDGGRSPSIDVFFVPQRYAIGVSHSQKKTRVEFYLGFNPRHFVQAFEVMPLKKYNCPNPSCRAPTEISKLGKKPEECVALCNKCETSVSAF